MLFICQKDIIPTTNVWFLLQHAFSISYRRENLRQYELRASSESECSGWIVAIREAR